MGLKDGFVLLPYRLAILPCTVVYFVGYCIILCSLCVLGAQVLFWLERDVWVALPCLYLVTDPWPDIWDKYGAAVVDSARYDFPSPLFLISQYTEHVNANGAVSEWLARPSRWLGVHKVIHGALSLLPVSLLIFAIGYGFVASAASIVKQPRGAFWRKQRELEQELSNAKARDEEDPYRMIEYSDDENLK